MRKINLYLSYIIFFMFFWSTILSAEENSDSLKVYWMKPVEINASKIDETAGRFPKTRYSLSKVLNSGGFELIRKGTFFAQDIYADGMKRSDFTVVVDGEHYHSACPNRMDSPFTRVNSLEMQSIALIKSSGSLQSGLGGEVSIHRKDTREEFTLNSSVSGSVYNGSSIDAGLTADYKKNRLMARFAYGLPYEDGNGRSFKDNYNYKDNYTYTLAEAALHGERGDFSYRASFAYTGDVTFPYLKMDERWNYIYSGFLKYKTNKLYFNYTDHLMDNLLRTDAGFMETGAKNLTIGAVGEFYDFYYRNWDLSNEIRVKPADDLIIIKNHMIPDLHLASLNLHKSITLGDFTLFGKAGSRFVIISDNDRMSFYKTLFPGAEDNRIFITGSAGGAYNAVKSEKVSLRIMLEAAIDAPQPEQLYISVQKPGTNPNWSGNPGLRHPKKLMAKAFLKMFGFKIEFFHHAIWDYVNLTKTQAQKPYSTYENIDAVFLGSNISYYHKYFDINAAYTWAENLSGSRPMPEIAPLNVSATLKSPQIFNVNAYLTGTYNDAQTRIDENLFETSSPSWLRLDFGFYTKFENFTLYLTAENILNETYYRHLSYMRDPFASGFSVYEPGTTVRITLSYSGIE